MDLSTVLAAADDAAFELDGTPMTATVPGGNPIPLSVVWDAPEIEEVGGTRQLRRAFWVPTTVLSAVPRGTEFVGPEPTGGANKTWYADQVIEEEPGKVLLLVTEVLS